MSACSHWYSLGCELGVDYSTLDFIAQAHDNVAENCFNDMLEAWLHKSNHQPTWMKLVEALKKVGCLEIASSLEKKFASLYTEEQEHIAAIEQAIKNKGKLDHTTMQGVFLGPARSGKSSLIKRLLKEKLSTTSPSTGATDKVIQVSVRKSSSTPASVFESSWLRLTYSSEAVRLMMLTAKTHTENQPATRALKHGGHASKLGRCFLDYHPSTNLEMPAGYTNPTGPFEKALCNSPIATLREHFDGSWTLYLSDTGGQMEFQEILPLLVSGPSIFFIVFPLNRNLKELFMIEYELPDGEQSEPYQSSLTLEEAILQSMATVAAMGTFTYKGMGHDYIELKPKVFLVATHKDKLDRSTAQDRIKEIDDYLQCTLKSTSFYRDGLVEFATRDQLMFTVNNLADDDSDFEPIRSRVNEIAKHNEYQMSIPTHWLIFSIILRGLSSRVISYDECFKVAQDCGINSEEELYNALWFLHTKMGVIRYFRYGDVSKIVIINPQLLFDKITELIVKTFTFDRGTRLSEEFTKKGLFTLQDFYQIQTTQDSLLTHSRFVELLKHLRILVPFPDGKTFLLPCVWTHADKALDPPKQHSSVPTLAIVFDCGYCPKGVTGSVVKYLLSNEMKSENSWELSRDQIFRDRVTFLVRDSVITLCMYPTHFEVIYAPCPETRSAKAIQDTCREVCQTILEAIHTVSKDINITCRCEPSFYCTCSACNSHIAKPRTLDGVLSALICNQQAMPQVCDLPDGYKYWLESTDRKKNKTSNPMTTLSSALEVVSPLGAHWKNIGVYLKVDIKKLNTIEKDYNKSDDCLREMLAAWLNKKVNPRPSWEMLAKAVEPFCPSVAEEICKTYCTS